jgi:hypothetical protein
MKLKEYIILLLKDNAMRVPSVLFWGLTLLIVAAGMEIKVDGHILTVKDCFIEMEDCWKGDCYRNSCPILNWLKQRKELFGG